jgi:hypothetical protein
VKKKVHIPYDDTQIIHGRIDWNEAEDVPPILPYFDVPFTEEGIMQAWLLDNLTDFMPKGWHSNYSAKDFVFDTSFFTQKLETFSCLAFISDGFKILPIKKLQLSPYYLKGCD